MNVILNATLWIAYFLSFYFTVFWLLVFLENKEFFKKETQKKDKIKDYPMVSVLIPSYNEEDSVGPSIDSVMGLDYPHDKLQLIVINDGSIDNTETKIKQAIKRYPHREILLINQENNGKAAALNNGLKKAKGKYFACLDADSYVDEKTLKKMVTRYESETDPELAIVTPAMKVNDPGNLLQYIQWLEYMVSIFVARLMSKIDCMYVAPGPFSLYRSSTIRRIGGFDEGSITEDQEIAYRTQEHHYKIKQCHDAYVYTTAPARFKDLYNQRNRWYKGSLINIFKYKNLFWNKNYGDFGMMQMTINSFVFLFSVAALFFTGYFVFKPIIEQIYRLYLVNFDIWPYLNTFDWSLNILYINAAKSFVIYALFALSIFLLITSHRNVFERIKKRSILYAVPYFLVYYIILASIAVMVLFELIIGKRQKW